MSFYSDIPEVANVDADRGLIMVEGAVPGAKGGWILVRDAAKRALPKEAPKPGKFRKREDAAVTTPVVAEAAAPAAEAKGAE